MGEADRELRIVDDMGEAHGELRLMIWVKLI